MINGQSQWLTVNSNTVKNTGVREYAKKGQRRTPLLPGMWAPVHLDRFSVNRIAIPFVCAKHSEGDPSGKVSISSVSEEAVEFRPFLIKEACHALDTGADGRCDGP